MHFLRPQQPPLVEPIYFDIELRDLDHFELRSFGGRHRFFFEDVRTAQDFQAPFYFATNRKNQNRRRSSRTNVAAFAPLEMKMATFPGAEFGGIAMNEQQTTLMRPGFAQGDPKKESTVAYWTQGLTPQLLQLQYLDAKTGIAPARFYPQLRRQFVTRRRLRELALAARTTW